jgi:hypothetical protein
MDIKEIAKRLDFKIYEQNGVVGFINLFHTAFLFESDENPIQSEYPFNETSYQISVKNSLEIKKYLKGKDTVMSDISFRIGDHEYSGDTLINIYNTLWNLGFKVIEILTSEKGVCCLRSKGFGLFPHVYLAKIKPESRSFTIILNAVVINKLGAW